MQSLGQLSVNLEQKEEERECSRSSSFCRNSPLCVLSLHREILQSISLEYLLRQREIDFHWYGIHTFSSGELPLVHGIFCGR